MVKLTTSDVFDKIEEDEFTGMFDGISVPCSAIGNKKSKVVKIEPDGKFYKQLRALYPKRLAQRIANIHAAHFGQKSLEDVEILVTENGEIRIRSLI